MRTTSAQHAYPAANPRSSTADGALKITDVPDHQTIFRALRERYDLESASRAVGRPRTTGWEPLLALRLSEHRLRGLRQAARQAIDQYGVHGWLSDSGRIEGMPYESLSLSYNPDLKEPGVDDVHQSTLGTAHNDLVPDDVVGYYSSTGATDYQVKHTYFDTYGFRALTPAAQIGALGQFLKQCRLSLVRSRLAVLYGDLPAATTFDFGWHHDETVFENLRLNIPLVTNRNYQLQIESQRAEPDEASASMSSHYLKSGFAYTFDTRRMHRVFATRRSNVIRAHLVLGFSPWFDHDKETDTWAPNEFFGKIHPFDILASGALHPGLSVSA